MPSFQDVQFPVDISYGSRGGGKFSTTVLELGSGHEKRNINWQDLKGEYNVAFGVKNRDQMDDLIALFNASYGRAFSFRFKDWADYQTGPQTLGTGDGSTTTFQITKTYTYATASYTRTLTKPVDGTLTGVAVDGVGQTEGVNFTVNYATGVITFTSPPALGLDVTITNVEFDVHARFDTDHLDVTHDFWETMSVPDIPVVEVRDDE